MRISTHYLVIRPVARYINKVGEENWFNGFASEYLSFHTHTDIHCQLLSNLRSLASLALITNPKAAFWRPLSTRTRSPLAASPLVSTKPKTRTAKLCRLPKPCKYFSGYGISRIQDVFGDSERDTRYETFRMDIPRC